MTSPTTPEFRNLIGGRSMSGSGPVRAVVDPTTGERYAEARDSTDDDVDAACRAATDALHFGTVDENFTAYGPVSYTHLDVYKRQW